MNSPLNRQLRVMQQVADKTQRGRTIRLNEVEA